VFVARLICSDPECAEALEAHAATAAELETLMCQCGCGLQVLGWADWVEDEQPGAAVVVLRVPSGTLRPAA